MRSRIAGMSIVLACVMAGLAWGQARTGSIFGTVTDPEGKPLPGVTVTLYSTAVGQLTAVTDVGGNYRFPSLPPADDYELRFTLSGFQPVLRSGLQVQVGTNVQVNVSMAPGAAEEVVVRGAPPVVDVKSRTVAINIVREVIQHIPTPRDNWYLVSLAPGVVTGVVNVGGHRWGELAYNARGTGIVNWSFEGIDTTEGGGFGGAGGYFDIESLEEAQVVTAGHDVESFSGGIQVNFVSKRGTNRRSGTLYTWVQPESWQTLNYKEHEPNFFSPASKGTRAGNLAQVGFNVGGAAVKDRIWYWVGHQYYWHTSLVPDVLGNEQRDRNKRAQITAKFNTQISNHMFEFLAHWVWYWRRNRGAGPSRPPETTWNQGGPLGVFKIQDDFTVSDNLFLSFRAGSHLIAWHIVPRGGVDKPVRWDQARNVFYDSYLWQDLEEPTFQLTGQGIYYRSGWLGGDHEVKFGLDFRRKAGVFSQGWANGIRVNYRDITRPELGGSYVVYRPIRNGRYWQRLGAYLQDTYRFRRWTLLLGLRYDLQMSGLLDAKAPALASRPDLFPEMEQKGRNVLTWHTLSPRLGLNFDVTGDGRTVAKLGFGMYAEPIGYDAANLMSPLRLLVAQAVWTGDRNGNGWPDPEELGPIVAVNYDPRDPLRVVNRVDADPVQFYELTAALERQLTTDLGVALEGFYRRYPEDVWTFPYDPDGQVTADMLYACWDTVAGYIPAEHGGYPYYLCPLRRPAGTILTNRPDYVQEYWGIELRVHKRLSRRWMFFGSATLQDQRQHFNSRRSYLDPTGIEQANHRSYATNTVGDAANLVYVHSRWIAKGGTTVLLPFDFNLNLLFEVRQGQVFWPIYRVTGLSRLVSLGWSSVSYTDVPTEPFGKSRFETLWWASVRLEKSFRLPTGRLTVALDAFNVTNNNTVLRRYRIVNSTSYNKIVDFMSPRVFRLTTRYDF